MAVDLEDVLFAVARRLAALTLALVATVLGAVLAFVALWDNSGSLAVAFLALSVVLVFGAARLADRRWWFARGLFAVAGSVGVLIWVVREQTHIGWALVPLAVFVTAPFWPRRS